MRSVMVLVVGTLGLTACAASSRFAKPTVGTAPTELAVVPAELPKPEMPPVIVPEPAAVAVPEPAAPAPPRADGAAAPPRADAHAHAARLTVHVDEAAAARVLLVPSLHLDRLSEVVRVLDVHMDSGDEDAALAALRAEAASIGADAVLGVEFHHGEDGGSTHLSGVAVRFLDRLPNP